MQQYSFIGKTNIDQYLSNKIYEFSPGLKQIGIQTSQTGLQFRIYLSAESMLNKSQNTVIIGKTKIYELDLSDTNLHIKGIELVPSSINLTENDYIIIDALVDRGVKYG